MMASLDKCLVTDVVTGKLDVRAAAASLPEEPYVDERVEELDALPDVGAADDDLEAVDQEDPVR